MPVSLTTLDQAYQQNFDTLGNTGTTNVLLPVGFEVAETGTGANGAYRSGNGSSNAGDTYSFGADTSAERAFGTLRSSAVVATIGASFTNNTGQAITSLVIGYTGEQWRLGTAGRADRLDFQYSVNATSLTVGDYVDVDALDFSSPVTAGALGALDGNLAPNQTAKGFTLTGLDIAPGQTFFIRWNDSDATGADDGLAIDDFTITPRGAAPGLPVLSVDDVTRAEGNSGSTVLTFTVSLSAPAAAGGVTFDIATADGTATTTGGDYVSRNVVGVTIPAGESRYSFEVTVNGDATPEDIETFFVNVTNVIGATVADGQGTGTITNDDAAPAPGEFSVGDVTLAEGDAGTTAFSFVVTRANGTAGSVTVNYATAAGTASADADYTGVSGTLTFADGESSRMVTVLANGDEVDEADETFTLELSGATGGATITDATGIGTITNDDAPPSLTVGDVTLVEGNNGVTSMIFTVTLSAASSAPVTVDYATAAGTATAGADYLDVSGTITFAAGETSRTVSVPVIGDTAREANEAFTITLTNAAGATIGDGSATGTIINDEASGYFSLASGSFTEDWSDTSRITVNDNWSGVPFIIGYLGDVNADSPTGVDARTLTGPALGAVDVIANQNNTTSTSGGVAEFQIANPTIGLQGSGTADAPSIVLFMDATGRSNVRFQANLRDIDATDDTGQQINVQYRTDPTGNWINVPRGYFADVTTGGSATQVTALDVTLPAGANGASTLQIRILTTNAAGNDEWVGIDDIVVSSEQGPPSYSVADAAVFEGSVASGTTPIAFVVTRAGDASEAGTVNYAVTFPGGGFSADAADFATPLAGSVEFAAGESSKTVTLGIVADGNPEADEAFTVTLSDPTTGVIADGTATGTIVNDDGSPPFVTIGDISQSETNGATTFTFTVTRTGGTGAFTVDYATVDGSATVAGNDYVAAAGTLSFAEGETTRTVDVTVNGDTAAELAETFGVVLTNPTGFAVIADDRAVATIQSDDPLLISQIQGSSYYSPILAAEGKTAFNVASTAIVTVQAVVTALDNDGQRQGFYLTEEFAQWDSSMLTSEGIYVTTRSDAGVGSDLATAAPGLRVGDIVTITATVMEQQSFNSLPRTVLSLIGSPLTVSRDNPLPTMVLDASRPIPNSIMTLVTPDLTDSVGNTFDADRYALSFWETVEGMLVTIPDMVVADGFVGTAGGQPFFQAYSTVHADPDQINSRGGLTIAGDPPVSPPDTADADDDTIAGGRHLHDGDINPDIIEVDFSGFAIDAPAGLGQQVTMGDKLGNVTGIIDFDFTDRKLFVTSYDPAGFVNTLPVREVTALGDDARSLTFGTFNVENLDPGDGVARFQALALAIATNLNAPDILTIEEIQDNNGAAATGGADASMTWQMLVDALNALTGKVYQWVDQEPTPGTEGGEPGGNIRVGFLYDTGRVQLGDLAADATLAERRQFTDRIGDGTRDTGDRIAFSDDMVSGEINTSDWSATRKSLLGQFTFNGNTVFAVANHFSAKGGSGEFWQLNQNIEAGQPENAAWAKRTQQAEDVWSVMNLIQTAGPDAGVIAGGDFNDFYFYRPLEVLTGYAETDGTARVGGARFANLTLTLSEAERFTYNFDGRSQAIDHVISSQKFADVATYDVVHINTGYNASGTGADADPSLSDHDPAVASFDLRSFAELLNGTATNDTIDGMGGNDRLYVFQGGDDTVSGGAGNDFIYYGQAFTSADSNDGGAGTDTVALGGTYNLTFAADDLVNVERLVVYGGQTIGTGPTSYTLTTDDANTGRIGRLVVDGSTLGAGETLVFNGSAETDGRFTVTGGAGTDTLVGGQQNDALIGGAGNDQLFGLAGDDYLVGGSGADQLRGGFGRDQFVFTSTTDSVAGAVDRIVDFQRGQDLIDLSRMDANNGVDGDQAFAFIDGGAFNGVAGELRAFQVEGSWFVEADVDGNGLADFTLRVDTFGQPLTASDFLL